MASYATTSKQSDSDGFGTKDVTDRSSGSTVAGGVTLSSRSLVDRGGVTVEGAAATTDHNLEHRLGQFVTPVQDVEGVQPEGVAAASKSSSTTFDGVAGGIESPTAAYIPSAYFRRVQGVAINPKGERITNGKWVIAQDGLPTAGKVDDNGEFQINLLRNEYENFALLVEAEDYSGLDYVWYQYRRTVIDSTRAEVVLVFEESQVTNGLASDVGVHLG
ncbi:hypothetical protein [Natrinema versiforme]|uniref:Uncharacterized protein n=1 Tax=Natrinema versiforme TaxID=88724 RepID=A0A4P8WIY9_9EURY|nr:hypothetical protein [Natrinema versiforme]QCS43418.1 hypothetical protein FEJ81_14050 [Natrinema versiforme]